MVLKQKKAQAACSGIQAFVNKRKNMLSFE